jgi:hypothetical protein
MTRPLDASTMVSPETSTGPRMYLNAFSVSHVMSGSSAGATLAALASTEAQSKSRYSWYSASETQFGSLASVGLAVGVVESDSVGSGVGASVADGVAVLSLELSAALVAATSV